MNFWCMLLFAENVVEEGLGVDSLVTKKMYPKTTGTAAILFYKVLDETSQMFLNTEVIQF